MVTPLIEPYPYGVYLRSGERRLCARVGDHLLDLADAALAHGWEHRDHVEQPTLDALMAAGSDVWHEVHDKVRESAGAGDHLVPLRGAELVMPFAVADYVDFYASEHHATNLGRMLRPGQEPLAPNWRHQPVGYHGRAGTVVVSGTDVVRPQGNVLAPDGSIEYRPTAKLDVEVEVGFIVGVPSQRGEPVPASRFAQHVFGVVLVNDWSARDIQSFETAPLGPFLGKSFQTSISPWVVPLEALQWARVAAASTGTPLSAYLVEAEAGGFDIDLELRVNGEVVSRPPYRRMHWSPAQMLAHMTANGASLRTGDLYASGTVSGPDADQVGSLIERFAGQRFLADGDEVVITATAPNAGGGRLDLGSVSGRVVASRP